MNNHIIYTNTFLNKLPFDLIEYIWCFNYENACRIIQYYTKMFIKNKVQQISIMMRFAHFNCKLSCTMSENYCLFYRKNLLNREDIFKTLTLRKCCSRHNTDKPKKLEPWIETRFNDNQYTPCNCSCRHLARFICRGIEL